MIRKRVHDSNLDKMAIVNDYAKGEESVSTLATKYGTSEENIGLITTRFWKELTNMKEARALITGGKDAKKVINVIAKLNDINGDFLALLSDDTSPLLTDAEQQYAWILVHTGDSIEALEQSKLDVGLFKEKGRSDRYSKHSAALLRTHYLNAKENVAKYISAIREKRYIDNNVGRARIQGELIDQLEYMKASNDPKKKKDILRCIELLGKTVGAFVERIEIRDVNPADALDELIEMAKDATTTVEVDETKVITSE